jgi:hypothetical protein
VTYANNKSYYPANVAMTFISIADMLELNALPKELILKNIFGESQSIIF